MWGSLQGEHCVNHFAFSHLRCTASAASEQSTGQGVLCCRGKQCRTLGTELAFGMWVELNQAPSNSDGYTGYTQKTP